MGVEKSHEKFTPQNPFLLPPEGFSSVIWFFNFLSFSPPPFVEHQKSHLHFSIRSKLDVSTFKKKKSLLLSTSHTKVTEARREAEKPTYLLPPVLRIRIVISHSGCFLQAPWDRPPCRPPSPSSSVFPVKPIYTCQCYEDSRVDIFLKLPRVPTFPIIILCYVGKSFHSPPLAFLTCKDAFVQPLL